MLAPTQRRAPDGNQIHCEGPVAFGHALLRTGRSNIDQCAIALDGQVWITADARIDGRADLIRSLRSAGRRVADDAPHAELILHAYAAFGAGFLTHLIGDFAFALWDARLEKLICARDHFGVRPFHYFQAGDLFGFASDVDALLAHPAVSRQLDEVSVADFLLFSSCQDADRSIYQDIRCLPPASSMQVTRKGVTLRKYWEVPRHAETRFSKPADYVQRFQELFEQAVTDRMPDGPVALQLSGGLDSPSIAAVAAARSKRTGQSVTAYNLSCRNLLPQDEERHYAEIVASHLSIPLVCQELGSHGLYDRSADPALDTASPLVYPHLADHHDMLVQISQSGAHVLLSGHGADALMTPSASYYANLLRGGRWFKLATEIVHHVRHTGSLAGMGLRAALWPPRADAPWTPPMPDWIDPEFAGRVDLDARWKLAWQRYHDGVDAYQQLRQPWLSRNFEAVEILAMPVIARYPFYDVRLVEFMLGLPGYMLAGKRILRDAMRDRLPESVRIRPKTSLIGDPARIMVTNGKLQIESRPSSNKADPVMPKEHRLALEKYRRGDGAESTWSTVLILAPVALKNWLLQQQQRTRK